MENVCLSFPLLPGARTLAIEFFKELEAERFSAYEQSQARIGVKAENWFVARIGGDDYLIGHIVYENFGDAVSSFSASNDEFDVWFKESLKSCTGIDLADPPELDLPELLSRFPR